MRVSHRRWIVRNFALTFAAVSLRLWLPASVASGIPFELAHPVAAWLCGMPNLLFAEFFFDQTHQASVEPTAAGKSESAPQVEH